MDEKPTVQPEAILTVTVFDENRSELNTLKENCKNLTIIGINDVDGYDLVKTNLSDLVSLRNKIDKRRKEFKNKVDEAGKAVLAELAPIEADLSAKKKVIDDEKDRLKKEADELLAIKLKERTDKMFATGFKFNGQMYVLEYLLFSESGIKALSDADFDKVIQQGNDVNEAAKKVVEQIAATNNELEAKRKELAYLQALIDQQKAALIPAPTFEHEAAMVRGEVFKNTKNVEAFNNGEVTVSGEPVMVEVFPEDKADFFGGVVDNTPEEIVTPSLNSTEDVLNVSKKWTPNVNAPVISVPVVTSEPIVTPSEDVAQLPEVARRVELMIGKGMTATEIYLAGFDYFKQQAVKLVDSERSITRKILLQEFEIFKP